MENRKSTNVYDLIEHANIAREKLNKTSKYQLKISHHEIKDLNDTTVYYAISKHFELILAESWRVVLENENLRFDQMLKKVWESEELERNSLSFKKDLNLSFPDFETLVKKQFLYFTDNDEFFLFSLFSLEKKSDVIGGLYHFLIKHFEEFSQLHKVSNEATEFWPNELIFNIMDVSVNGIEVKKEKAKVENNYVSTRERECSYFSRKENDYQLKNFRANLYYDFEVNLFFMKTFHRI